MSKKKKMKLRNKRLRDFDKKASKKLKRKVIKMTSDKGTLKKALKQVEDSVKIPKLEKARREYNLRGKKGELVYITVEEFKNAYSDKLFLIPNLDKLVEIFGEENIGINDKVFEPILLNLDLINIDVMRETIDTARLVVNTLITACKKSKQVEAYRDAQEKFEKAGNILVKEYAKVSQRTDISNGEQEEYDEERRVRAEFY